jgi:antitoxin HicB
VEQSKFLAEREMAKKDSSYTVIFEPLEGGGYQVLVPALPEIISAGHTLHEARRMARDAIRCALEGKDINREPRTEKLRVSFKAA